MKNAFPVALCGAGRAAPLPGHSGHSRLAPPPDFARRTAHRALICFRIITDSAKYHARARAAFALALVLALALANAPARTEPENAGASWQVVDGDTIRRGAERIRLCAVDAPERGEPGGAAATAAIRALLLAADGAAVEVNPTGGKSFGRIVARVRVGEVDVQLFLLAGGLARLDSRYANSCEPAGLSAARLRAAARAAAKPSTPPWNAGGR